MQRIMMITVDGQFNEAIDTDISINLRWNWSDYYARSHEIGNLIEPGTRAIVARCDAQDEATWAEHAGVHFTIIKYCVIDHIVNVTLCLSNE